MTDAAWPDDALEVGRIVEAWGLKGWFRVHAFAAEPLALLSARCWHLRPSESALAGQAADFACSTRRLTVGDIWAP